MSLISLAIGIVVIYFVIKFLAPKQAETVTLLAESAVVTTARGAAIGLSEANKALKEYDNRPVNDILRDIVDDTPTKKK